MKRQVNFENEIINFSKMVLCI